MVGRRVRGAGGGDGVACRGRPVTAARHGSRSRYINGRCRCVSCRAANSAYDAARSRRRAAGERATDLVDAAPVRRHVFELADLGMGWRQVGRVAGVSRGIMERLIGHCGPPTERLRPDVAARILAVQLELAGGALVDGAATRVRLQRLAEGATHRQIAARTGCSVSNVAAILAGERPAVKASTARAVLAAI